MPMWRLRLMQVMKMTLPSRLQVKRKRSRRLSSLAVAPVLGRVEVGSKGQRQGVEQVADASLGEDHSWGPGAAQLQNRYRARLLLAKATRNCGYQHGLASWRPLRRRSAASEVDWALHGTCEQGLAHQPCPSLWLPLWHTHCVSQEPLVGMFPGCFCTPRMGVPAAYVCTEDSETKEVRSPGSIRLCPGARTREAHNLASTTSHPGLG